MIFGKGSTDQELSTEDVREIVRRAGDELQVAGKRVLFIIPDGTRTMPMPLLFGLIEEEIGRRARACDYLVALGTHQAMSDAQLSSHVGRPVVDGVCGKSRVMNHRWDLPETFAEVGTVSAEDVERISGGLLRESVPVRINRAIFDYDRVIICGPVFPHEVVGFSGGNKYLFPGISGRELIDVTHWLGALIGSYDVIGAGYTPVRELIDCAAAMVQASIACLALVVTHEGIAGMYFGDAQSAWKSAADLSSKKHIHWVEKPFRRVLSVMPTMYDDLWTAAKGMYKVEPAIEDGGGVVIYAPHLTEVSYVHGAWIDKIGYHCRDYFLKQWTHFAHVPRGVLAHSTHLKGKGSYDAAARMESPRIQVSLATGIPRERCEALNLGYMDPATVRVEEWEGLEDEGIKVIPRAGEVLYKVSG